MPTENRSSNTEMVSVPPCIGLEPLVGRYYPAQCRRCGWVGSSEELTEDDAQCTRDAGGRLCLGDCDELGRDDLLGIIQAMAKAARQDQVEPVGEVVAFGKGLHEIAWAAGRMPRLGAKLYTHAEPAEVERLAILLRQTQVKHSQERDTLRAQLAEAHALLRIAEEDCRELEIRNMLRGTHYIKRPSDRIKTFLSASAEPQVKS